MRYYSCIKYIKGWGADVAKTRGFCVNELVC